MTRDSELFLEALRSNLPMYRGQSDAALERKIGAKRLEDASTDFACFIRASVKTELSKNEQLALTTQLLRCLQDFLKSHRDEEGKIVPLTLLTLISRVSLLPAATDKAFPGYADAQMLMFLIQPQRAFLTEHQ